MNTPEAVGHRQHRPIQRELPAADPNQLLGATQPCLAAHKAFMLRIHEPSIDRVIVEDE